LTSCSFFLKFQVVFAQSFVRFRFYLPEQLYTYIWD